MNMELRNRKKKMGIKRFINSFRHSFDGIIYAYTREQSMFLHIIATILVFIAGIYFDVTMIEWLFILLFIGLIMGTELLNTSIEATIDLISPNIHPLAKVAKDTAAAAVCVLSIIAFLGGLVIFLPKIIEKFF